jgi:hypothetical protein
VRTKRIVLLAVGLLGVGLSATALAWFEGAHYKNLPATSTLNGKPFGCATRGQAFQHEEADSHASATLTLIHESWDTACQIRRPTNTVSGTAHVFLIKSNGSSFDFCTSDTVTVATQNGIHMWTRTFDSAPCGPGWYKVVSCSDTLSYKSQSGEALLFGKTTEDCSSYLTWMYSPAWHPWCSNCGPAPG